MRPKIACTRSMEDKKPEGRNADDLFLELLGKLKKLRIAPRELSRLPAVRKLRAKRGARRERVLFWVLGALFAACALVISVGSDALVLLLAQAWFRCRGFHLEHEMCVLDMPAEVQNMFMPPFDCSACRNLTEVGRVRGISPEEFESKYAYSTVPVIVSDGTANWTALESFSLDFFRGLYLDRGEEGDWECQFFPYQTEFQSLAEALSMSDRRQQEPWYFGWSNCDSKIGSILREHYRRPYFLPRSSESTNIDWIFMGTPGYGAHLHIDHVTHASWQAQVKGRKLWTLEPPPECYNECVQSLEVVVNPGEVIVLDTNKWYHKTLIIGDEVSITIGSEFD